MMREYVFPGAKIVLGDDGMFAAVSDRGDYVFRAKQLPEGVPAFQFFLDYTPQSLLKRISSKTVYDGEATLARVKQVAQEHWGDDAEDIVDDAVCDYDIAGARRCFDAWASDLLDEEAHEDDNELIASCVCYQYPEDAVVFAETYLPQLQEVLRQDLAEENARAQGRNTKAAAGMLVTEVLNLPAAPLPKFPFSLVNSVLMQAWEIAQMAVDGDEASLTAACDAFTQVYFKEMKARGYPAEQWTNPRHFPELHSDYRNLVLNVLSSMTHLGRVIVQVTRSPRRASRGTTRQAVIAQWSPSAIVSQEKD